MSADECRWCRECASCDYGLPMTCTCGDCTCTEDCGHPNCERAEWADREARVAKLAALREYRENLLDGDAPECIFASLKHDLAHIGAELRDDGNDVREWLTRHIGRHPYHDSSSDQQGAPVSLIDDVKTELSAAENKAAEVYNHAKTVLEQHLPGIENAVQAVENEPFIKAYLGAQLAVPEHLVAVGLDILAKLVSVSPAPVAPVEPVQAAPAPAA